LDLDAKLDRTFRDTLLDLVEEKDPLAAAPALGALGGASDGSKVKRRKL
jgi:hypothetical protein